MPIDARINMGLRPQTYDAFAAYDTGRAAAQTAQANQMAMQAAQAEAELNRNAMLEAQTLDPNDRAAQQRYALRYGAAGTPFLTALSGVDTNFAGRGTERRAEGKFNTEQQAAASDALSEAIGLTVQDPSDTRIAGARAAFVATGGDGAAFDAYVAPILAVDYASGARQPMVVNMIGGSPEGERLVDRFTRKDVRTNMGDRSVVEQTNPHAPGFTPPVELRYGKNPNPVIVQTSQGIGSVVPGEPGFTPATDDQGNPVMPYQAPSRTDTADADARAGAAEGLRSTLGSLRGYYDALNRSGGIVSTERGAGRNVAASAAASLPGRVLGRTLGFEDQTQRDNIQTAIPMIVASLKDLTGMSAQQMNSNVELQLFLGTVGDPSKSIETVNEALTRFERYVDRVAGAQGGGGDVSALEAEARRRGLIQ